MKLMVLPKLAWVDIEPSTVEECSGIEVILAPEAIGHLLDGLNLGVEAFAHGIRDAVPKVGDDIPPMALDQPRHHSHGRQPRVSGPPEPTRPEALCLARCGVGAQLAQALLDRPRTPHLEVEASEGAAKRSRAARGGSPRPTATETWCPSGRRPQPLCACGAPACGRYRPPCPYAP